jgi:large conductance mechanosensitive channel
VAIDGAAPAHYRARARRVGTAGSQQHRSEAMSFGSEFKEFALKGNVMDLAVGVIIGGAFGKIVDSLVGDVIMPVVGRVVGGLDFSNYFIALAGQTAVTLAEAKKGGAVLAYGNFITVAINFVILAFIIFLMIKQMNRLKREAPPPPPAPPATVPEDVLLLREIRDSLRK